MPGVQRTEMEAYCSSAARRDAGRLTVEDLRSTDAEVTFASSAQVPISILVRRDRIG